jgi:thiamine-phosphate pyrophosphorylase
MKILVITPPQPIGQEVETIHEFFRMGLEILHLRKPGYSSKDMEKMLQKIESRYHDRIMLHGNHELSRRYQLRGLHFPARIRHESSNQLPLCQSSSCHSINELEACGSHFEYLLVSPVFDSISKEGYYAGINLEELEEYICRNTRQVVGLGGITPETLRQLPKDCWGAAALGYVWSQDSVRNRLSSFEKLSEIAEIL